MKKIRISAVVLLFCMLFTLMPNSIVQAQVISVDNIYLELNTSDDVIFLTKDTPSTDPGWAEAGITDVSSEKDGFDDMGVVGILYDPSTHSQVRLLRKASTQSMDVFDLKLATDEEKQSFYDTLLDANDENTVVEVSEYSQGEFPFFRYNLSISNGTNYQEVIYGTIVNGALVYFDVYAENPTEPIDESFQQTLVSATNFTKRYTKAEYAEIRKKSILRAAIVAVLIIAFLVVSIVLSKKNKKKQELATKKRTESLQAYYKDKKEKQAQGITQTLMFEAHPTYSQNLISQFCSYTMFLKNLSFWIISALLYLVFMGYLYLRYGLGLQILIAVVVLGVFAYYQNYRKEKLATLLWKPYASSATKVADFHFYEDYFTITGIQYFTEYPYLQITSIRQYKEFIYLYFSNDKAVYLTKDSLSTSVDEFMKFMNAHSTLDK